MFRQWFFLSAAAFSFFFVLDLKGQDMVKEVDKKIADYRLTEGSKLKALSEVREHILSYAHLERKAALYGQPENLYYRLKDDAIAKLPDKDFFEYLMAEFAKERDSHARAYYPDYMSCRKASVPIELTFIRSSDAEDSWGRVIVSKIKDDRQFAGVYVGDELLQIDENEMNQKFFEGLRTRIAQSNRGYYETISAFFLTKIDGRYSPMPSSDKVYMLFRDYKTGGLKELDARWQFDYSKCTNVDLFKGIKFPEKKKEKSEFELKSGAYGFEKIKNPNGLTEELYTAGLIRKKGTDGIYGFIKFYSFQTFEDKERGETVNEFIDKTMISLGQLMNIFAEKKVKGLVVDVRMNGGGWVELAHHIARVFSKGNVKPVYMQFANGDWSLKNLLDEIATSEKEIKSIKRRGVKSGFPYTRAYFNWDGYADALKDVPKDLRLAKAAPHFKEPAVGLNPLGKDDFSKVVLTDRFCLSSCDMFVALMKDNKLAKIVGETTRGAGGMVHDHSIDMEGIYAGKKKIESKFGFRYAYTNVLTPAFETIEDVGVAPDSYYRSNLARLRDGEEDGGWLDKAIQSLRSIK